MNLLDGKKVAEVIRNQMKIEVADMIEKGIRPPHIAAVLVGNVPESEIYVKNKEKAALMTGFTASVYKYPENIEQNKLLDVIHFLNEDDDLDGYIVQLPLPKHIDEQKIIEAIKPEKDIDGFHPVNIGKMVLSQPCFLPATPYGIMQLLKFYKIETVGKNCVVIGRSHIVGTPISILLSRKGYPGDCTVTLCHTKSQNVKEICAAADILIVAAGQFEYVKADMVKEGAVVIDVGQHRVESKETKSGFTFKGDVKFDEVAKKASWITPVPGGVGPMTIASLLMNGLKARKMKKLLSNIIN